MASMIHDLGAAAIVPGRAFRRLETDPKTLRKGIRAIVFIGFLYTISAAGLAAAGALLPAPAFLPLPPYNYYFFEMLFALPLVCAAWLAGAGGGNLLASLLGGRGSAKTAAGAWAFAFAVPSLLMWLPHAVFSGFLILGISQKEFMSYTAEPGVWRTGFFAWQGLALVLLVLGSVKAASVGRALKPVPAALSGLLAAGLFALVLGFAIR
ncbi:MAG: hypothetical protein JW843_00325 [Candidatus Aminicenantes bacterium]|nr:hypothetical protein [Candidatus Aminicenantes bacterium]